MESNPARAFFAALIRVRVLFWVGTAGIGLSAVCAVIAAIHGGFAIGREGDLTKAITFDGALGLYYLTLGFFVPLAGFSPQGLRRWLNWTTGIVIYAYGTETLQTLRGLDPRFTKVGTPLDRIAGGVFFLTALGVVALFCILAAKLLRRDTHGADGIHLLAIRYGIAATMIGFSAGLWMSAIAGRRFGAQGNILPLHAIGFHGLQAVPIVAWFLSRSQVSDHDARRWVHVTGLCWIAACLAIAWQTAAGAPVTEFSIAMALAFAFVLVWAAGALRALLAWMHSRPAAVTEY
ncbi:MAG TPA: hypothetical protein VKG79_14005 [Bryobacteraceae bacterium]|nr:hypothetical protein [Bryobacteraceae bacterium]